MRALGIIVAVAAVAFFVDQQYYYGRYWGAVSSMLRQIGHSFGWH
jgi:predicted N-acyltransferase